MDNIPNDRIQNFFNHGAKFNIGDVVRSGQWTGTVTDIFMEDGVHYFKVTGINGKSNRVYLDDEIELIEFDSNQESNRHMEKLIKEGKVSTVRPNPTVKKPSVDELLDAYNNNKEMYETTGIEDFKRGMDEIMSRLKEYAEGK